MGTIVDELEERQRYKDRVSENSARVAVAWATFDTVGQGSVYFDEKIDFDVTFIEQPMVAYGGTIDADELSNMQALDAGDAGILPVCCGFVTDWDTDTRGYYTGAWVAVRVYFPDGVAIDAEVEMTHNFTFTAVALKDVPTAVDR